MGNSACISKKKQIEQAFIFGGGLVASLVLHEEFEL